MLTLYNCFVAFVTKPVNIKFFFADAAAHSRLTDSQPLPRLLCRSLRSPRSRNQRPVALSILHSSLRHGARLYRRRRHLPCKASILRAQRLAPASSTAKALGKTSKKHRLSLLHGQEIALHAFGKTSGPFPRLPTAKPSESRSSCIRCGPLNFPYFFIDICAD